MFYNMNFKYSKSHAGAQLEYVPIIKHPAEFLQ